MKIFKWIGAQGGAVPYIMNSVQARLLTEMPETQKHGDARDTEAVRNAAAESLT